MKKTFVILEQGCEPNYPLTATHKEQFNTKFSDCFRLNWKEDRNDKNADFFKKDICWSEGRSYLYEQVKGKYDYYFFIDDDISIEQRKCLWSKPELSVAEQIKDLLEIYKPVHGSINNDAWPNTLGKFKSDVFTMIGGDLCIQFFSESFANLMFPTWEHGSQASMWYPQFLSHVICPQRTIYLNRLTGRNTRHVSHGDQNTTKLCTSYFRDLLISQQHKTMWGQWYRNRKKYIQDMVPGKPHEEFLNVTAKDIEKYITKKWKDL